jgi:hypothetical protein
VQLPVVVVPQRRQLSLFVVLHIRLLLLLRPRVQFFRPLLHLLVETMVEVLVVEHHQHRDTPFLLVVVEQVQVLPTLVVQVVLD